MFEEIGTLVSKHGFYFQAWDDRYGRGVWAALGLFENAVDAARDLSSCGDDEAMVLTEFFVADWLPLVTGRTLIEAMTNLETVLASLPTEQRTRDSDWANAVSKAFEDLQNAHRESIKSGRMIESCLAALPRSFSRQ